MYLKTVPKYSTRVNELKFPPLQANHNKNKLVTAFNKEKFT